MAVPPSSLLCQSFSVVLRSFWNRRRDNHSPVAPSSGRQSAIFVIIRRFQRLLKDGCGLTTACYGVFLDPSLEYGDECTHKCVYGNHASNTGKAVAPWGGK